MIEGWKLRRELMRPFDQLRRLPSRVGTYLFGPLYYDLFLARHKRLHRGLQPMTGKVAVYVVFPQPGAEGSLLTTLNHLADNGYSTVVVSNKPLGEANIRRICDVSHMIIERRNFGYDFGAYRDGVLALGPDMSSLTSLVLLNDSVWFPVPGSDNWLKDADENPADLFAAVSNYGNDRRAATLGEGFRWTYSTDHRRFHYCSFALRFGPRILADKRFHAFWRRFPLTNNKNRTVTRGEVGLSAWVLRRGYTHAEKLKVAGLETSLQSLSGERLRQAFRRLVIPADPRLLKQHMEYVQTIDQRSDTDLIRFILVTVSRMGAAYALPEFSIKDLGFPFLKKSPIWLDAASSDRTLEIAADLSGPEGRQILDEARTLRALRAPQFDAR